MLNRNRNKLEIFENFQLDFKLPKFDKDKTASVQLTPSVQQGMQFIVGGTATTSTNSIANVNFGSITVPMGMFESDGNTGENGLYTASKKQNFIKKFFTKVFKEDAKTKKEREKTMTILNFFTSLATSLNDLKTLHDIAVHYETAINNAVKGGQAALADSLRLRLEAAKSECQLVTLDLNKFLTEEQIVDFYLKTEKDKNLKLTYIKNFIKPIPTKILELKAKLDEKFVFDNYVILHYDPNDDATDLTAVEKEERKKREDDPILFGLIQHSRRLYYVADWVDDYCSLTLDVVLETLGEKVNHMNNENVKTFIDRGVREDVRVKTDVPAAPQTETKETVKDQPKTGQGKTTKRRK